ncbi:glycosyltransferase family 2 protein [Pseudobutyrivibrio xylanivorans]|uniref:Glycosyltransferase involved in cell wall bisynthesis n=1 Tax=Pseudobutyrivibrio xylanivorans DSM 14809 TaxID=1123012 RepID=A0A1M6I2J9_PSEXY|nr:glycosyltransferase family 2 protein [Pseudobutyrivibrio xylanivorans]SHJ28703.1 Glycosyltransferase involved in cell wall bisynthesis [Pseudobutyrivibrio xylanivorans DSM 14809]
MSGKISIIIPVYNVEKYLDQCLESVVNQTYKDLQIILVDDKSPDGSGALCDAWVDKDNRIEVVHKDVNEGLGFARNTGLNYVKGDYILFLDSDDFYDLDLCEKTMTAIKESDADICYFGHKKYVDGKTIDNDYVMNMKDKYEGKEIIDEFLAQIIGQAVDESGLPKIDMSAWRVLYKKDIIFDNNVRFCSEREYLCEDLFFRIELCKFIKKVAVVKENLYNYRYNDDSLTSRYREDRFDASKRLYNKLCESIADIDSADIAERAIRCFMNNLIFCLKQEEFHSKNRYFKALGRIKEYSSDSLVQELLVKYPIDKMKKTNKLLFKMVLNKRAVIVFYLVKAKRIFG